MRPCPGQPLGAHAFASGACVDCGEYPPVPACEYCADGAAEWASRYKQAAARVERLEAAICETLALVTSKDPVALSPFDAIGVYKLALEHLRASVPGSTGTP
jgi:hypothetical protein